MGDLTFESKVGGETVKLRLKSENLEIERKCDNEYHLAFTQLMRKGIMPKATLEQIMEDNGVWTKKSEDLLNDLQTKLAGLQLELDSAKTHEKGLAIAREMGLLRAEALRLVEVKAAVLTNSCEALADNIRRDAYIAYALVYADSNKPVFEDFNDFLSRCEEEVVLDARKKVLNESIEAFNESLTGLPEVDYIRQVEERMDEAANEKSTTTKKKTAKKVGKKTKKKVARKTNT